MCTIRPIRERKTGEYCGKNRTKKLRSAWRNAMLIFCLGVCGSGNPLQGILWVNSAVFPVERERGEEAGKAGENGPAKNRGFCRWSWWKGELLYTKIQGERSGFSVFGAGFWQCCGRPGKGGGARRKAPPQTVEQREKAVGPGGFSLVHLFGNGCAGQENLLY